jgi:hypothetical protein
MTEHRLHTAFRVMEAEDPDLEMTAEEAVAFVEQFVSIGFTKDRRDEFGDYVIEMQRFADAKALEAGRLIKQAAAIEAGIERMKQAVVRTFVALEVADVMGNHRRLRLKTGRGTVEVVDETQVPDEFFRIREDADWLAIDRLAKLVVQIMDGELDVFGEDVVNSLVRAEVVSLREAARIRRRAVDKKAIQAAWKEAGGAERVEPEQPAATFAADGGLVYGSARMSPVVPGVEKRVTTTLEVS